MADSARPWVKVWESWWSSRSHADLSLETLAVGLRIMSLTAAAPEQEGEGRFCLRPDGKPLSRAAIARECRIPGRRLRVAIEELAAVGTLTTREDGAVGFPNWDRFQVTPSALRMRKKRHSDARSDGKSAHKKGEGRRESVSSKHPPQSPRGQIPINGVISKGKRWDHPDAFYEAIVSHLAEAVKRVTGGRDSGPRDCAGNRAMIDKATKREGATLEDWMRVIDSQAANVAGKPDKWQWLCLSTLHRPENFARRRDAPVPRESHRGSVDPSTQNHDEPPPF